MIVLDQTIHRDIIRRLRLGQSVREIMRELGVCAETVSARRHMLKAAGIQVPRRPRSRPYTMPGARTARRAFTLAKCYARKEPDNG